MMNLGMIIRGRNRGYGEITQVDSCSINEDDMVVINGCEMFELKQAKTLIDNNILNDSVDGVELNRIYYLSDKVEKDFKLYKWGDNY